MNKTNSCNKINKNNIYNKIYKNNIIEQIILLNKMKKNTKYCYKHNSNCFTSKK